MAADQSSEATASTSQFTIKSAEHVAFGALLLQALDIVFRHDLRPVDGPNKGLITMEARKDAAFNLVTWALGDGAVKTTDQKPPAASRRPAAPRRRTPR